MAKVRRVLGKIGKALLIGGGAVGWIYTSVDLFHRGAKSKRLQKDSPWVAAFDCALTPPATPIGVLFDTKGAIQGISEQLRDVRRSWRKYGVKGSSRLTRVS